ncbi:hypothetical protein HNP11_004199 [Tsukamurella ocularis]|uniref:MmpS family transport accessory protein n=1 Tax=Tsukamurella ocularis TaxID=1970234 RepID=UPI00216A2EC1|nr:MmpS family transport accessory protein [Tsukamurella ocularis]MCS3790000.1 hypothetical protein [Tsukamurella ocularis]
MIWVPVTIAVTLAIALAVAVKFPRVALVDEADLRVTPRAESLSLGTPKVRYTVTGSGSIQVSYITDRGDLATARVTAPWSVDLLFPSPMRPASVTATSVGGSAELGCRIVVDGASRAQEQGRDGTAACTVVAI